MTAPPSCWTCSGSGDCREPTGPTSCPGASSSAPAVAVALANGPEVLLADEPTGELDSATAAEVFGALQQANADLGVTVLIVTHDPAVSSVVRRVIAIRDGLDQHRDPAPPRHRRRRGSSPRGRVRGPRPGRAAAVAPRDDRAAGDARPGTAEGRTRPYRGLARRRGSAGARSRRPCRPSAAALLHVRAGDVPQLRDRISDRLVRFAVTGAGTGPGRCRRPDWGLNDVGPGRVQPPCQRLHHVRPAGRAGRGVQPGRWPSRAGPGWPCRGPRTSRPAELRTVAANVNGAAGRR